MATWEEFTREAPGLAAAVQARFQSTKHHVLATLRADGSPRVSGTEVDIHDGEMTFGSMPGARKAHDLQRDGRCAVHANPGDGSMAGGDAKVAGYATEIDPPPGAQPQHAFHLDLHEAVLTSLHPEGDRLVIELWRPGRGVSRTERT